MWHKFIQYSYYVYLSMCSCSFAGGFFSTLPTVLVDLNGIENIVKSMAFWTLALGSAFLLGVPFSGIFYHDS